MTGLEEGGRVDAPGGNCASGPIASEDAYARYFTESYERHVAWTLKEFKSAVRDRESAEDLVAEAFKRIYPRRGDVVNPDAALKERIRGLALDQTARTERSINDSSVVAQAEARASDVRPADAAYASQECLELFNSEAVATLGPADRKIYDLYVAQKSYDEIGRHEGLSNADVEDRLKLIFVKLLDAMSKLVTVDNVALDKRQTGSLRSPKAAEEAMGRLPRMLSSIVRLTYVDKLPAAQIAIRLKLASTQEVASHLERALFTIGRLYQAKMPDDLIAALAYKPSGGKKR
jgi:RNA polymerase sigma factor (sigma-70 family)